MKLLERYPWVYEQFSHFGFHTVRISDKFIGGLLNNLIIYQVLMRLLNCRSVIASGVRVTWVNTMHQGSKRFH